MAKRIIALIGNGKRHYYFAKRINESHPLFGVVVEKKYSGRARLFNFFKKSGYNPLRLLKKIREKILTKDIDRRYDNAERDIVLEGKAASLPKDVPVLYVDTVNSKKTKDFIKKSGPDIVAVSGTSLIKKDIIESVGAGRIINLHTGLSPYYRGGPCTFWCLYNEEPEYLGATVHFLTTGIDSGDIILSRRMKDVKRGDNEATLDCKVVKLGAELMSEAIRRLDEGYVRGVPQWEKGRFFAYSDRTLAKRLELERKLKSGLIERCLAQGPAANPSEIS